MGNLHKVDPNRAKNVKNKCSFILNALVYNLEEQIYDSFKKAKSIEELDKKVEELLNEYYTFGNNIIDYYGIDCDTIE